MPARGGTMEEGHKESIRQTALARSAWLKESAHLREAIEEGDSRLAALLVRNMIRNRNRTAA